MAPDLQNAPFDNLSFFFETRRSSSDLPTRVQKISGQRNSPTIDLSIGTDVFEADGEVGLQVLHAALVDGFERALHRIKQKESYSVARKWFQDVLAEHNRLVNSLPTDSNGVPLAGDLTGYIRGEEVPFTDRWAKRSGEIVQSFAMEAEKDGGEFFLRELTELAQSSDPLVAERANAALDRLRKRKNG